ncbi:MAG: hypothetical protein WAW96_15415 [Alphaproteobacteria bacterium]
MPLIQATLRSFGPNADKGQLRSQQLLIKFVSEIERSNNASVHRWYAALIKYKIAWETELERWRLLEITNLPAPIPHPDDIVIDFAEGSVRVVGPMTREEKEERDADWQLVRDIDEIVSDVEARLRRVRSREKRKSFESILRKAHRRRRLIVDAVGEPKAQEPVKALAITDEGSVKEEET